MYVATEGGTLDVYFENQQEDSRICLLKKVLYTGTEDAGSDREFRRGLVCRWVHNEKESNSLLAGLYLNKPTKKVFAIMYQGSPHPNVWEEQLTDDFASEFSKRWDPNQKDTLSRSRALPTKLKDFLLAKLGRHPQNADSRQQPSEDCSKCQQLASQLKLLQKKHTGTEGTERQYKTLLSNIEHLKTQLRESKAAVNEERKMKKKLASELEKLKSKVEGLTQKNAELKTESQGRLSRCVEAKFDIEKENELLRQKVVEQQLKNTTECTGCARKQLVINNLQSNLKNVAHLVKAAQTSQSLFFEAGLQSLGVARDPLSEINRSTNLRSQHVGLVGNGATLEAIDVYDSDLNTPTGISKYST
jgi:predicted  nucleic acid-binding Zn-ribbon protein